jgi:hypothetical protein
MLDIRQLMSDEAMCKKNEWIVEEKEYCCLMPDF